MGIPLDFFEVLKERHRILHFFLYLASLWAKLPQRLTIIGIGAENRGGERICSTFQGDDV
jgi:hypothetical protein